MIFEPCLLSLSLVRTNKRIFRTQEQDEYGRINKSFVYMEEDSTERRGLIKLRRSKNQGPGDWSTKWPEHISEPTPIRLVDLGIPCQITRWNPSLISTLIHFPSRFSRYGVEKVYIFHNGMASQSYLLYSLFHLTCASPPIGLLIQVRDLFLLKTHYRTNEESYPFWVFRRLYLSFPFTFRRVRRSISRSADERGQM